MNCEEIQEHMSAYRDDELDEATHAAIASELASCESCQEAYRDLEALSAVIERAVLEPAAAADLTGFADEVMARIAAEVPHRVAVVETRSESLLDRIASMLGLDARSMVMAGAFAAAALAWGLWTTAPSTPSAPQDGSRTAAGAPESPNSPTESVAPRPRRGMELETASAGRNAASVQQVEVAHGRVVIDDNADDPDRPVVVWHIVGDEVDPDADVSP
jgi:anti-sigma factor RsiW